MQAKAMQGDWGGKALDKVADVLLTDVQLRNVLRR
jgi:hypothetical protein